MAPGAGGGVACAAETAGKNDVVVAMNKTAKTLARLKTFTFRKKRLTHQTVSTPRETRH